MLLFFFDLLTSRCVSSFKCMCSSCPRCARALKKRNCSPRTQVLHQVAYLAALKYAVHTRRLDSVHSFRKIRGCTKRTLVSVPLTAEEVLLNFAIQREVDKRLCIGYSVCYNIYCNAQRDICLHVISSAVCKCWGKSWIRGKMLAHCQEVLSSDIWIKGACHRITRFAEFGTCLEFQVYLLLAATPSTMHCALFAVGIGAGLRPSELLSMRWEDINMQEMTATIRGSKTAASQAAIPFTNLAARELMRWYAYH